MEGYDFFDSDEESTEQQATLDEDWGVRTWNLGNHEEESPQLGWDTVAHGIENIENDAPGLADALTEAKEITESFNVGGFECAICGLNHGHSDDKHDIRNIFNVTTEFAEGMKFSPFCHCGVSELARLVMYFNDVENIAMFDDQHEFEAVRELDSSVVRNIHRAMQEVTRDEAQEDFGLQFTGNPDGKLDLAEAIEWETMRTGSRSPVVPVDIRSELREFYRRVDRIKSAAGNAPIPSETEQSLNDTLGEL